MYLIDKKKVKRYMYDKGLSTTELCDLLEITRTSFYSVVNNAHKTYLTTALSLADLLEVSVYDIVKKI